MKLIVNADDFGYSKGVNLGIVEAHREGVVTSATLMVNMPAMEHAVSLARKHPDLGVGVHLVLTCGRPVRDDVPSLTDQYGFFRRRPDLLAHAQEADIEREWTAQIERFLATGLTPTHLDSHHHVHAHPLAWPVICRLAERYGLPVRPPALPVGQPGTAAVPMPDRFFPDFYGDQVSVETLERIFASVGCGETAEVMCHPAYLDEPLLTGSSYALPRARELYVLTDERVKSAVRERGIHLATYREVRTNIG